MTWKMFRVSAPGARNLWASKEFAQRQWYRHKLVPGTYELEWAVPESARCLGPRHPRLEIATDSSSYRETVDAMQYAGVFMGARADADCSRGEMAVHKGVGSNTASNIPRNGIAKCCPAAATSSAGAVFSAFRFRNCMGQCFDGRGFHFLSRAADACACARFMGWFFERKCSSGLREPMERHSGRIHRSQRSISRERAAGGPPVAATQTAGGTWQEDGLDGLFRGRQRYLVQGNGLRH
jgi:hypothetical protein